MKINLLATLLCLFVGGSYAVAQDDDDSGYLEEGLDSNEKSILKEEDKTKFDDVKSNFFSKLNKGIDGTAVIITNNKDGIEEAAKTTAPKVAVFIERESKEVIKEAKSGLAVWKWVTIIGGSVAGFAALATGLYYWKEWRKPT